MMKKKVYAPCLMLALLLGGCAGWLSSVDEVNNPSDDAKLSECRAKARVEKQLTGDAEKAWQLYLDCTSGLRPAKDGGK